MDITPAERTGNNRQASAAQGTSAGVSDVQMKDRTLSHDDSAIDLEDDSMLLAGNKFRDIMASDPVDAEGDVVVI
jgi:regulatory factor X